MNRRTALRTALGAGATALGLTGCTASPTTGGATRAAGTGRATPAATGGTGPTTGATAPAGPAADIVHGPRDRPAVALTFHGQGDPALVGQLLTELETGGARVTVMAVGGWLAANPALARRVLDGGHELGNHTQHHLAIAGMGAAAAYAEIDACARVLRTLTGSAGRWFRPSRTPRSTATIRAAAARAGYGPCLAYDVDSLDYTDPPPAAVVRTTLDGVRGGSIVSLHCGHRATVAAIGPILAGLGARGLRAVTASELVGR